MANKRSRSKTKDQQVARVRNTIIAVLALIVLVIVGFGMYVTTPLSERGEIVAGEDYTVVDNPRPTRPGPIQVAEFFSYACVHCKDFEPALEDWLSSQGEDVAFKRVPVTWSPAQTVLAQAYVTLEATDALDANHGRIFRAIHDARKQFLTPESVAEYVDGRGVSKQEFMREFNSPRTREQMREVERQLQRYRVNATPSVVVAGKYVVGMQGGPARALQVVDHLIAQEKADGAAGAATESPGG